MKISQRNLILGLVLIGAGSFWLGVSLTHWAEGRTVRSFGVNQQRALSASGIEEVEIQTVSTDIIWHTVQGQNVRAHLQAPAGSNPPELIVKRQGARAIVEVRHHRGVSFSGFSPGRVALDVYLPQRKWRSVSLRTVSANAELPAITSDAFVFHSTSGDLKAAGLSTSGAEIGTTSGWINVNRFRGDLDFSSVSGDLQIGYAGFDGNQAKLKSTSGRLSLDLPDSAQFTLDARSVSGDIRCKFPVTIPGGTGSTGGPGEHQLSGSVGGGTNSIQIQTVSGDIQLY